MKIVHTWKDVAPENQAASVAMGNFDGLHLGHCSVIAEAAKHGPLGVLTFEPHPRDYFNPHSPPFRLMDAGAKAHRLQKLGVQYLYELPFDAAIATLTPDEFARHVLVDGLGIRHITVGADFSFGKGRAGTGDTLREMGRHYGFGVTIAPLLKMNDTEISSTAIRTALAEGRPDDARIMLGHWHRIEGEVIHGEKRGRELGFPTANMNLGRLHLPKLGVYAVKVDILTGPQTGAYYGVSSLGTRPMFGANRPNLETYIFDFEGDLYGQEISVALTRYLRPEAKFGSLDELITQMGQDCIEARASLAGL